MMKAVIDLGSRKPNLKLYFELVVFVATQRPDQVILAGTAPYFPQITLLFS